MLRAPIVIDRIVIVAIDTDDTGLPSLKVEISRKFAVTEAGFIEAWNGLSDKPSLSDGLVIE